jgi:Glycosyltransferase family 87
MPVMTRKGWLWPAAWLAIFTIALAVDAYVLGRAPAATDQADFGQFYRAVHAIRQGLPMYPPLFQGDRVVYNLNPPHFHLLVLPLAPLDAATAFWVWTALGIATLALIVALQTHAWLAGLEDKAPALLLLAWLFVTPITGAVLVTGAPVWVLLPLVWGAWQSERRGWNALAGILLGLAASVKLFLLVFVPWLVWRREWRGLCAFVAAAAAWFVAGFLVFGARSYEQWGTALGRSSEWGWGQLNGSVWALASRAMMPNPHWASLTLPFSPLVVWAIASCAILSITYASLRSTEVDTAWARLLVAALLTSTLGWIYYAWWLIPVATVWRGRTLSWAALLALTVPPQWLFAGQPSVLLTVTLASVYTWGLLALWADLMRAGPPVEPYDAGAKA